MHSKEPTTVARSFVDIAEAMMRDTHLNITHLQEVAADPALSNAQLHTIRNVLHAEELHLLLLERASTNWDGANEHKK